MAYLAGQDEEQGNPAVDGQTTAPLIGGGSSDVGGQSQANNAGVGKGGTGGYVNIQSYLNANQGDTGSANLLSSKVGGQFGQEADTMHKNATDYVNSANDQVEKSKISNQDADGLIKDSASQYNYAGTQNDAYKANQSKVQNALTGAYTGPTSYTYGFSAPTQNYGNALKDNSGFDQLMSDTYSSAAGSPLNSGQYQLQKQLDVNNGALTDARNNLINQYSGLETDRDNTVNDATTKLGQAEQNYRTNQNTLKDYLTGQLNTSTTGVSQKEADARAAYNNDLMNGQSGIKSIAYDYLGNVKGNNGIANREAKNIWSNNLTWDQLAREYGYKDPNSGAFDGGFNAGLWNAGDDVGWDQRGQALNNFYSQENAKYASTADPEKRNYNALLDFLGSTDAKKDQGFKVKA